MSSEPTLAPLTGEVFPSSANSADDARVDIAARGFWQRCERAFCDIRIFNPYASTHRRQTLSSSFKANERQKKRLYNGLWKLSMALSLRSFLAPLVDVKGRPITFYRLWLRNSPAGRILRSPSS